tara:strand:+ start:176 stop:676 length:501 start_codon:yes stop_codon:yes gene_type:complete
MEINCKINPCNTNLDMLNSIYNWIPSSENIRPIEDIINKKDVDYKTYNILYSTNIDQILIRYFNYPKKFNRINNKFESKFSINEIKQKKFIENEYPYSVPKNTYHYIMWYTYDNISDEQITKDIYSELYNKLNNSNFEFVWYKNPKMSIPEIFHVQVFWHINYQSF